jgi:hypothetical protein
MKMFKTLLTSLLLIFAMSPVIAAPPGGHLNVEHVMVIVDNDGSGLTTRFTIIGKDLDFGNGPVSVTLGGIGDLNVDAVTDTVIEASVPGEIPAGDYLLTVSNGNGQSQNDEYDLTIGAVGPQGPQGEIGLAGADGTDGADGLPGTPGADGSPGADGAQGDKGDVGSQGEQGTQGDVGPQAEPGVDGMPGNPGLPGPPGPPGLPGGQGPMGLAGQNGADLTSELCALYQLTANTPPATLACVFGQCATDEQCQDGTWCRPTESGDKECAPFQQAGGFCGGFTVPWLAQRCGSGLDCVTPAGTIDAPGICTDPSPTASCDPINPTAVCGVGVRCEFPADPGQPAYCGAVAGTGAAGDNCEFNSDCQGGAFCVETQGGVAPPPGAPVAKACALTCVVGDNSSCSGFDFCASFSTPLFVEGTEFGACLALPP